MARVMLLCAGYGTRLAPLTDERPKPLAPVGDRPLLAHLCGHLVTQGVEEVVINTHHLPEQFTSVLKELPLEVQVSWEAEILGTAGGVAAARAQLRGPAVIWNGDILAAPNVRGLLASRSEAPMQLLVAPAAGSGSVGIDAAGRVSRLRGEIFGEEVRAGDYIGIARLNSQVLDSLPERGCLIGDVALPLLRRGVPIETLDYSGYWSDSGTLSEYLKSNSRWLEERGIDSWLGPGARVTRAVERSVVGAGARVDAEVEECVVWPGAHVHEPASRSVITRAGCVVPVSGRPHADKAETDTEQRC